MNTIHRTAAVLLLALLPLSPAVLASDRNYGGDRHHQTRHDHGRHDGYYRHHNHYYWRHHQRHHHRHHGVDYRYYDGRYRGAQVVLPVPPLPPVIVPPHVVLHKAR